MIAHIESLLQVATWSELGRGWLGVVLLASLLAVLALVALFERTSGYAPDGHPALALQRAFRVTRFREVVAGWTDVAAFRRQTVRLDFLFPVALGVFLSTLIAWLHRPWTPDLWALTAMAAPLAAVPLDWLENGLHLWLLRRVARPEDAKTESFSPVLVAAAAIVARAKLLLLGYAGSMAIVCLFRQPLEAYEFLFALRLGLLFTGLLVLLPLAALGWPAQAARFLGNLLVGLHPAKKLPGLSAKSLLTGDVFAAVGWLFAAAWSAMFTWSLVARSWTWERSRSYSEATALVSAEQATAFTLIAVAGVVVVVVMARCDGGRGRRWQAIGGALGGALAALVVVHLAALPAIAAGDFVPLATPTFGWLAGDADWAVRAHETVSRIFASRWVRPVLFRDFLFDESGAAIRLRLDHYFASICVLLLLVALVIGYARNRSGLRQRLPAVAYVLTLVVFLIWGVLALQVRFGTWSPVLLIIGLWLVIPGKLFGFADHYFRLCAAAGSPGIGALEVAGAGDGGPPAAGEETGEGVEERALVVACASGGGIVSAGWVTWVLSRLVAARPRLARELRLVSGASGGAVGLAFLVERLLQDDGDVVTAYEEAHHRAVRSSLSAAAFGFAYLDFLRLVSFQLSALSRAGKVWDRGLLLETAWQRNAGATAQRVVHSDPELLRGIRDGRVPLPVFNVTALESGRRVMITPLRFVSRVGNRARTLREHFGTDAVGVGLWTAARLSATFPFVSPATRPLWAGEERGETANQHLIDGGYHDNFGVSSALDFLEELVASDGPRPRRVALVEINAYPSSEVTTTARGWAAAAIGPVAGVLTAHFDIQRQRNREALEAFRAAWSAADPVSAGERSRFESFRFEPPVGVEGPLSWHLTQREQEELRSAWKEGDNLGEARRLIEFLAS